MKRTEKLRGWVYDGQVKGLLGDPVPLHIWSCAGCGAKYGNRTAAGGPPSCWVMGCPNYEHLSASNQQLTPREQ